MNILSELIPYTNMSRGLVIKTSKIFHFESLHLISTKKKHNQPFALGRKEVVKTLKLLHK
jgi:hypothetical protein